MTSVKRALEQEKCVYCNSNIQEFMIQDDCSVVMCENQKVKYNKIVLLLLLCVAKLNLVIFLVWLSL
jgi:hypothetical protein